ncbi:trace amine-associated receptor 13c-like [Salvelinus namaycush]|uniref:Trace amine-associated receptor 13c-like n=1 Tax=Salvelinus namaycush TaxID=8040 RepID=A0A8U1H392_SALNM|nr:trace amine-associated receptor 13c-like [Salvelinus namaycush]
MCSPCCAIYALQKHSRDHHDGNTDVQESVQSTPSMLTTVLQVYPRGPKQSCWWTGCAAASFPGAVTVFLNVLVIISISHFKQLHTPTNLLILSLAVSDLLVGLIVIPVTTVALMESCWGFGKYFCAFHFYMAFLCTSLSLGNLVLISIDRYVAVCDPLLYLSKITIPRTMCSISITWFCCIIYQAVVIKICINVQVPSRCLKECFTVEGSIWGNIVDIVITMVVPCSIIITLYMKIFVVARSQARKVFSKEAASVSGVKTVQANKSERKAAKTLSIVVFNYLICWIPSLFILFFVHIFIDNLLSLFISFLPLVNSLINPIIYAFFYPWFKVTAIHILTLKLWRS